MNTYTATLIDTAAELGYTVYTIENDPYGSGMKISFSADFNDRYAVHIDSTRGDHKIQTVSYGALAADEFEQMMNGYARAQRMVRLLESVDYDALEPYTHPAVAAQRATR